MNQLIKQETREGTIIANSVSWEGQSKSAPTENLWLIIKEWISNSPDMKPFKNRKLHPLHCLWSAGEDTFLLSSLLCDWIWTGISTLNSFLALALFFKQIIRPNYLLCSDNDTISDYLMYRLPTCLVLFFCKGNLSEIKIPSPLQASSNSAFFFFLRILKYKQCKYSRNTLPVLRLTCIFQLTLGSVGREDAWTSKLFPSTLQLVR